MKQLHIHLCTVVAGCASLLAAASCVAVAQVPSSQDRARTTTAQLYADSIPGTLVRFEMVRIPAGRTADGMPIRPFDIGRTETTWDMYDVFALGLNDPSVDAGIDAHARPSSPYGAPDYGWGHAGYPVMSVTLAAAEQFCAWLSERTGHRYRLPMEAEWEYVAMLAAAGSTLNAEARDARAWHRGNADDQTHGIALRAPDDAGLFDLFGNVAEWVVTADGTRVTRGGSFRDAADVVGPLARAVQSPSWNERDPQLPKSRWWLSDGPFVGFRIVREPAPER